MPPEPRSQLLSACRACSAKHARVLPPGDFALVSEVDGMRGSREPPGRAGGAKGAPEAGHGVPSWPNATSTPAPGQPGPGPLWSAAPVTPS